MRVRGAPVRAPASSAPWSPAPTPPSASWTRSERRSTPAPISTSPSCARTRPPSGPASSGSQRRAAHSPRPRSGRPGSGAGTAQRNPFGRRAQYGRRRDGADYNALRRGPDVPCGDGDERYAALRLQHGQHQSGDVPRARRSRRRRPASSPGSPPTSNVYPGKLGHEGLRRLLAARETAREGVEVDHEHVVLTNGSMQGVTLVAETFCEGGGDRVVLEEFTYSGDDRGVPGARHPRWSACQWTATGCAPTGSGRSWTGWRRRAPSPLHLHPRDLPEPDRGGHAA